MDALYQSLTARRRPEDVAQLVLEHLHGRLSAEEEACLEHAARYSLKRRVASYTSMLQEFARPIGLARQIATAGELFPLTIPPPPERCDDPDVVEDYIRTLSREIHKVFGRSDFKGDRLNHAARRKEGLDLSRRRYNKLFRHLAHMERKLYTLIREIKKRELTMVGKSGLASTLSWETFAADEDAACFIAYLTARSNLRSEFTIAGQQRPYDEIADMLFARCKRAPQPNWWAIAHVYPSAEVMLHLTDAQKGELLGRWFTLLEEIAGLLEETWSHSHFDRATMIVRRGDDSTTWNNMANAWNKARDNWIALLYAMRLDELLDGVCPGKVLRLMAADVAAWHRMAGGGLHPDTAVWAELPPPWEVVTGRRACNRSLIKEVCRRHGVAPVKSGWVAAKPRGHVAPFRPTPELVHGVTVGNPLLATLLRKAGYFSGKVKRRPVARA